MLRLNLSLCQGQLLEVQRREAAPDQQVVVIKDRVS